MILVVHRGNTGSLQTYRFRCVLKFAFTSSSPLLVTMPYHIILESIIECLSWFCNSTKGVGGRTNQLTVMNTLTIAVIEVIGVEYLRRFG